MTHLTNHKIRKLAQSRGLLIALLSCWLFVSNVAFVHIQQHYAKNLFHQKNTTVADVHCQLCTSGFNYSPFIANFVISVDVLIDSNPIAEIASFSSPNITLLPPDIRGPPIS